MRNKRYVNLLEDEIAQLRRDVEYYQNKSENLSDGEDRRLAKYRDELNDAFNKIRFMTQEKYESENANETLQETNEKLEKENSELRDSAIETLIKLVFKNLGVK